uniref:NADH-ubiquinone oxidoreductase chain 6 n=1 Tax=Lachesilla anna TaxID=239245 RepID=A0A343QCH1_9NEOP|nr:NADH dehydrogenase subunit 6 [Lachesilla anna]ATU07118.1 NADH dehydrogenase subunit 6 [Lachesilla anna]
MYLFLIPLLVLFTLLFFFSINPMAMGLILIFQTISLALFLMLCTKSSWFLYMFILIFIGGMLVLFIYVTSIFPNEKFNFSQLKTFNMTFLFMVFMSSFFFYLSYLSLNSNMMETFITWVSSENSLLTPTKKFFSSRTNLMIIFLVNYLFFCMIVVIKITNFFQGPLRKMN